MATLYEITEEYMRLLELAEDPDTDPEVFADTLEGLQGALEVKADGYGKVIRELEAFVAGLETEIARMTARKRGAENSIIRMKESLKSAFFATGTAKLKTELFTFSIRKNPPKVVIDDPDRLPERFLLPQPPKIDTARLKNELKEAYLPDSEDFSGIAHLEQGESLTIR